jgi:hypothetical protein
MRLWEDVAVMDLWAQGPLTVRQVRAIIQTHRPIAYTRILIVSSRMGSYTDFVDPYNGIPNAIPSVQDESSSATMNLTRLFPHPFIACERYPHTG